MSRTTSLRERRQQAKQRRAFVRVLSATSGTIRDDMIVMAQRRGLM